jgi:chaperone modulatory protein CbpM
MNLPLQRKLEEASELCGVSVELIVHYIDEDWLNPIDREHKMLDEEDLARLQLIRELRDRPGVNDEGVPIILHLLDQLNALRRRLREL